MTFQKPLGMYCLFFVMTLASYGLPLYMVGDFWRAFSRLMGCIGHLKRHRMLSHGLDSRFLDATKHFPKRIYALLTKVSIRPEDEAHRLVFAV